MPPKGKHLVVGRSYTIENTCIQIVPIVVLNDQEAIFVSEEFAPTSFIKWNYSFVDDKTLSIHSGEYFWSLEGLYNSLVYDGYIKPEEEDYDDWT